LIVAPSNLCFSRFSEYANRQHGDHDRTKIAKGGIRNDEQLERAPQKANRTSEPAPASSYGSEAAKIV